MAAGARARARGAAVVRGLERAGVPHPAALAAVLVDIIGYYAGYSAYVALALLVLRLRHALSGALIAGAVGVMVIGAAISAGALWLAVSPPADPAVAPRGVRRLPVIAKVAASLSGADPRLVTSPALLSTAAALRFGNFALDALTLGWWRPRPVTAWCATGCGWRYPAPEGGAR